MKTLIFTTNPESTQVKALQEKGPVFVINEERAIKALQAMKNVKMRGEYQVVADEGLKKYLDVAKKLGYQEHKEPTQLEREYQQKLDSLVKDYQDKMELLALESENKEKEYREKIELVNKEKEYLKDIKKAIKKTLYGQE